MTDCLACDLTAGRAPLPGGEIHRTARWVVEHCLGPLGLGTLVVKPLRHVVHVADLDADEAVEMGPLLHAAARVVTELVTPEQVYVSLWSHAGGVPGHIHYIVQPVTRPVMDLVGTRGAALQAAMFRANVVPPAEAVAVIADRARAIFSEVPAGTDPATATSKQA